MCCGLTVRYLASNSTFFSSSDSSSLWKHFNCNKMHKNDWSSLNWLLKNLETQICADYTTYPEMLRVQYTIDSIFSIMLISTENLSSLNIAVTVTTAAEHSRRFYIRNVKVVFLFSDTLKVQCVILTAITWKGYCSPNSTLTRVARLKTRNRKERNWQWKAPILIYTLFNMPLVRDF